MSGPLFLSVDQCMQILLGEFPLGVYANDTAADPNPDNNSFSSSEIRTHAQLYANMYSNLLDIYLNKFISTVQPDGIGAWEKDLFQYPVDASLSFSTRQMNALTKYRSLGGISYSYIYGIVQSILQPLGFSFQILVYSGINLGVWRLDFSSLDLATYLGELDPIIGNNLSAIYQLNCNSIVEFRGTLTQFSPTVTGIASTQNILTGVTLTGPGITPGTTVLSKTAHTLTLSANATLNETGKLITANNYENAGLTLAEFQQIQRTAYTYEIQIFGIASAGTLSTLDQTLTQLEPARSTHVITNNAPPPIDPNIIDMGPFLADTLVDRIDCGLFTAPGATYDVWDFEIF